MIGVLWFLGFFALGFGILWLVIPDHAISHPYRGDE